LWSLKLDRLRTAGGSDRFGYGAQLAQLQQSERDELFCMWYRSRRLFDIYGALRDRLEAIDPDPQMAPAQELSVAMERALAAVEKEEREEQEADPTSLRGKKLFADLLESLPSRAPLEHFLPEEVLPGTMPRTRNHRVPHPQKMEVDAFHDAVKSRVEYLVENLLGNTLLKDLVQDLRQVCEQEAGDDLSRSGWVSLLKKYKIVYSMLVDQAQSASSVKLLNRTR